MNLASGIGRNQNAFQTIPYRVISHYRQQIFFRKGRRKIHLLIEQAPVRASGALVNIQRFGNRADYQLLIFRQIRVAHQHMAVPARMAADYPGSKAVRRFEIAGHLFIIALPPGVVYRPGWAGRRRT